MFAVVLGSARLWLVSLVYWFSGLRVGVGFDVYFGVLRGFRAFVGLGGFSGFRIFVL